MFWITGGQVQPKATHSNDSSWKWSEKLLLGQGSKIRPISYFALPDVQPEAGDSVWMYMWVQAGTDNESPLRFTY